MAAYDALDALVERLSQASWKERDPIKEELKAVAGAFDVPGPVIEHLEDAKRKMDDLELRWEIDEVIEAIRPPPPAPPEPEEPDAAEEEETPPGQLSASDLQLVYDDPRGLALHKTKVGDRWFATQRNPQTGQPQTFELHPNDVQQLKLQLQGSPYWVLGAGV